MNLVNLGVLVLSIAAPAAILIVYLKRQGRVRGGGDESPQAGGPTPADELPSTPMSAAMLIALKQTAFARERGLHLRRANGEYLASLEASSKRADSRENDEDYWSALGRGAAGTDALTGMVVTSFEGHIIN
jgi:hypothetical protein